MNEAQRQRELLEAMAKAFEEGIDPFSTSFLSEHQVTAQECFEMGHSIASILKGYLAAPVRSQVALLAYGILAEQGLGHMIQDMMNHGKVREAIEHMERKA